MGKIVAIGGCDITDEESEPILQHILKLSDKKNSQLLFLPTASFDKADDIDVIISKFAKYGYETKMLLLSDKNLSDEYIKSTILSSDIIYVGGGNLKFLMDTWKSRNADVYIKQAYNNGTVLSGSSAGSLCWFNKGYDDCGDDNEFMFIDCVGLIPYYNCPHFDSEYWKSFIPAINKENQYAIAIDNDTAFSLVDGEYEIIKCYDEKSAYFLDSKNDFNCIDLSKDHIALF